MEAQTLENLTPIDLSEIAKPMETDVPVQTEQPPDARVVDISDEVSVDMGSESEDEEADFYVTVYNARPGNFYNFMMNGTVQQPKKFNKVSIGMGNETLVYLGPVIQGMLNVSESNFIELTSPNNTDYKDNIILLNQFIEEVSSLFNNEQHVLLSQYVNTYHKPSAQHPLIIRLVKLSQRFAREHNIVPQKGQSVDMKMVQTVFDFGTLCEYLQIDIGILASSFWFRTITKCSVPLQINDILDIPRFSHEDNVYRAKKELYFLKYPASILEPSRELLDTIELEIDENSDIDFQIEYMKQQFEDEQNQRLNQFNDEIQGTGELPDEELLKLAKDSNTLNEDDYRKIEYEFTKRRFLAFHQDVLTKEHGLNRKLNKFEFKMMKDASAHLSPQEKSSDDDKGKDFRHLYNQIVEEYEKQNLIEREN